MTAWLPGCVRQDFGTNGGSWTRAPAIVCIHSTEGTSWPGYDGGQTAPHFTIDLETGERRQHIPLTVAARALSHPSGTPETNRAGVIQIEVIGTCDPPHRGDPGWLYLPDMTEGQAAHLSHLIRDITDDQRIPWTCGVTFNPYPESYGDHSGRLSRSAFASYTGILGHQSVPDNDHGDPGNINIGLIMGTEDEDMGDVVIVGIEQGVAAVISQQVWERYSPGGRNLATHLGDISQNVAWLTEALQAVAAKTGTRISDPPPPLDDAGDTNEDDGWPE